jgi:hypothetical protein
MGPVSRPNQFTVPNLIEIISAFLEINHADG